MAVPLAPNTRGCNGYDPQQFRSNLCRNCGGPYLEHEGIIDDAAAAALWRKESAGKQEQLAKEEVRRADAQKRTAAGRAAQFEAERAREATAKEDNWYFQDSEGNVDPDAHAQSRTPEGNGSAFENGTEGVEEPPDQLQVQEFAPRTNVPAVSDPKPAKMNSLFDMADAFKWDASASQSGPPGPANSAHRAGPAPPGTAAMSGDAGAGSLQGRTGDHDDELDADNGEEEDIELQIAKKENRKLHEDNAELERRVVAAEARALEREGEIAALRLQASEADTRATEAMLAAKTSAEQERLQAARAAHWETVSRRLEARVHEQLADIDAVVKAATAVASGALGGALPVS